jgi:kynurenine formamidase
MGELILVRGGRQYAANLDDPLSIAMPLDFGGVQPNHFGAARATAAPLSDGAWVGDVRAGGSVNCEQLSIVPHCNGTHTECVGHLTTDRLAVHEVLRGGISLARLVSIRPASCESTGETPDPDAQADEPVITRASLAAALADSPKEADALIVRTLPNDAAKLGRRYDGAAPAAYLTPEAATFIALLGVRHLIVDLPSLDRARDGGRLVAHRAFWGLPAASNRAHDAARRDATVTELAWIAPTIRDGWYLLDLQIPAFLSDAVPSRPILYPARLRD